jgi:mono/diheme cytochrome c family protein
LIRKIVDEVFMLLLNKMTVARSGLVLGLVVLLSACDSGPATDKQAVNAMAVPSAPLRQFDAAQLALGKQVFADNCARCHGAQAEGAVNWRKVDADGDYPAPPLNGSGHAWHHSVEVLTSIVRNGSPQGKGKMPGWKGKLDDQQIVASIAWVQSGWPQPVYDAWFEMQQRGR